MSLQANLNIIDDVCCLLVANPNTVTILAAILAILIGSGRTKKELLLLGEFFSAVSDLLLTQAAQLEVNEGETDFGSQLDELKKAMDEILNRLDNVNVNISFPPK